VHDDGGDLVVFQMGKADCRWIKERRKWDITQKENFTL
jgi:hypothetical protein